MAPAAERTSVLIYSPKSLNEALSLFVPNPQAKIYAGGTAWQQENLTSPLKLPSVTISLHLTEDLKKPIYGERFVDLGAAMSLNQVLQLSDNVLPSLLKDAARTIGTSTLRNLATLGGNLCQGHFLGDLFPVLSLLGSQFEIRSLRTSRWLTGQEVAEAGRFDLHLGEMLTRIRVPQTTWPLHFYEKIGTLRTPWDERLAMIGLARPKGDLLEALRLAFYLPHSGIVRHRELEAELTGQRLPLRVHVREAALEQIDQALGQLPIPASVFQRQRILHMTRWILTRLDDD